MLFFKRQPTPHTLDYLVLLLILVATAITVRIFSLTKSTLVIITIILSIGYVSWGVTHHQKSGHLDKKIVFEYLGLATLINILILILVI